MQDKKAQIGESITWVVATIIIVIVLGVSVFVVSFSQNQRELSYDKTSDLIALKSLTGYLSSKNIGNKKIFEELKNKKDFSQSSGELAKKIFENFYSKDYEEVWLGVIEQGEVKLLGESNGYFGTRPNAIVSGRIPGKKFSISESIYLEENLYANLFFVGEEK